MSNHSASLRVLIVEDGPLIRSALVETLAEAGHSAIEAGSGAEAVSTLERSRS